MSKEFIQAKIGGDSIHRATRQQNQLSYFTTSEIQEEVQIDYFEKWAERHYNTNSEFLNWVKNVFKTENFMAFAKYYRNPNPSSKLINTRIKEPLSRVFFAEDSYFNYKIKGKDVEAPEVLDDNFQERLFDALMFRHNDIIIHDLSDINSPYREFISIDKVVSIQIEREKIIKIAYTAEIIQDGERVFGYAYMDAEKYAFYTKEWDEVISIPHDIGVTPATFVSKDIFGDDPVVRKSIFSYLRADLEEYTFLKTLQKMTEPNGAIPIAVKLQTKEIKDEGDFMDGLVNEPMSAAEIGSQTPTDAVKSTNSKGSVIQAGSIIEVPAIEKADGSIDMDLAKNFLTFFYTPIEALNYLSNRLQELENNIVTSAIGDYSEGNEASMNEKQIQKTFVSKEDKLRWVSDCLSSARQKSDNIMLALKYGKGAAIVDMFYGSDFFWETPETLYQMFKNSPNSIERKNILIRLAKRRNRFNEEKSHKESILYKIMPYVSDQDFMVAVTNNMVGPTTFQLQTRFSHWIDLFEATYGSIVTFWLGMDASESQKILLLTNLLTELIKSNTEKPVEKTETNGKETSGSS